MRTYNGNGRQWKKEEFKREQSLCGRACLLAWACLRVHTCTSTQTCGYVRVHEHLSNQVCVLVCV